MKKETIAILEMLLCAALWSIAGILMKFVPWNGFALAGMRSLIAGLTIASYMLFTHKRFVLSKRTLISGLLTGSVYICFTVANKLTTAASAIVLQFTDPVFIVLFSALLLHKKPRRADMLVVLVTLFGIALFFFDQLTPGNLIGNGVAILSGVFMASMYMSVGNIPAEERFSAILIGQCFTFLVGLPALILTRPVFTGVIIGCVLLLGVFQLGISYILFVNATLYCPPLACALLAALEPLLNPVWVLLFYGERPGPYALIGGLIVITAVTLWCILGKEREEQDAGHAS